MEIAGRIQDYSRKMPYVWSRGGDWYDEKTGAFVGFTYERGHYLLPVTNWRSISKHRGMKVED